jgi:hypothetical protein
MKCSSVKRILATSVAVCLIPGLFFLEGCEEPVEKNGVFLASAEEMRIPCPENGLDAVVIREAYGGAAGGHEWYVFINTKGSPIPADYNKTVLHAPTLTGEKLVWRDPHLLEVHYDIAHIEQFRNLWSLDEVRKVDSAGESDYFVEIRLEPSSENFSLLNPGGKFKER